MKDTNYGIISGLVVSKTKWKDTLTVVLKVKNGQYEDFPRAIFFGEKAKKFDETVILFENVTIECYVSTAKKKVNGEFKFYQTFVGLDLYDTPKDIDKAFGINSTQGKSLPSKNEFKLSGEVVHTYTPENGRVSILTLSIKDGNRIYFPKISCFGKESKYVRALQEKDKVCLIAHVTTKKKALNDGTFAYYETLIGDSIQKL